MGLGAVAGVPAARHGVADVHPLPGLHLHAATLQVRQQDERTIRARRDDYVVTGQTRGSPLGSPRLSQHVRHQRELGSAGLMVGFPVVHGCDLAGDGSHDRATEPDEDLRWFGADETSPRSRGRSSSLVDGDEVDCVGGSECIGAVARHPVGGAVLHAAATGDGNRQDDGIGPRLVHRWTHNGSVAQDGEGLRTPCRWVLQGDRRPLTPSRPTQVSRSGIPQQPPDELPGVICRRSASRSPSTHASVRTGPSRRKNAAPL